MRCRGGMQRQWGGGGGDSTLNREPWPPDLHVGKKRQRPPQELTDAAHKAARLIDTDAHIQTASRAYTRPFWYQSRVWDPDD